MVVKITVVIIQYPPVTACNEAIKGFGKGCKGKKTFLCRLLIQMNSNAVFLPIIVF
ncbi:MAG: hypothetical protein JETT_0338 [Candidatus Jettenia ecosi]|uniref:Uncharacterized protein n=1 Tax=Candidatus Jettenia ecosi TaxID=2494326 RepID=A0A533QEZ4_9BACT|nr:MAG: hypothetical protein JETT_0338 [Candidatus Jettenia ecosi]